MTAKEWTPEGPAPERPATADPAPDFAHTDQAARMRQEKATALARYAWDRAITGAELLALPEAQLRRLARAADAHPPSSMETWKVTAALLEQKAAWALRNPGHTGAAVAHADEKIMWVKRPVPGWS